MVSGIKEAYKNRKDSKDHDLKEIVTELRKKIEKLEERTTQSPQSSDPNASVNPIIQAQADVSTNFQVLAFSTHSVSRGSIIQSWW